LYNRYRKVGRTLGYSNSKIGSESDASISGLGHRYDEWQAEDWHFGTTSSSINVTIKSRKRLKINIRK
jgi:hypothetical protein